MCCFTSCASTVVPSAVTNTNSVSATNTSVHTVSPIIAIGDIHADLSSAKKAFAIAGVTNEQGEWIAENTTVVQTGDITDRGPDGLPILEWLLALEQQAGAHNSRFVIVMGNHEAMNLQGDWRYVSPLDIESFGSVEARKQLMLLHSTNTQDSVSEKNIGKWAQWLLSKDAVVQIDDTVFVHGGVSKAFPFTATALSGSVRDALEAYSANQSKADILGDMGPLWYRGYWKESEASACVEAEFVLREMGAKRMVMGHTTQKDGKIHQRCAGTLFAIDTGISRHYGENIAALRIEGETVFAIYPTQTVQLYP